MSCTNTPSVTLCHEIQVDHDNIRDLFARFQDARSRRDEPHMLDIAHTIIQQASIHADAEEMSVYPLMEAKGMHDVADHDRAMHQGIKRSLAELDTASPASLGSDTYAALVHSATREFLSHAQVEESTHLPRLTQLLTAAEETRVINDFLKARRLAPTHPHPRNPQSGSIAQTVAAIMARPMDELSNLERRFVPLKYHHVDDIGV